MQTNRNSTRRSLLVSATALILSIAMLVGTTFAWFTDSASTGVNKIQAGNLQIGLEMKDDSGNWVNAEGETLEFKKAAGATQGETVLWEPGCTYKLPELRIVNKGNLALKYKIQITGIQGDAKLNEVIDWTINDAAINLTEKHLLAGQTGDAFTIKGHMQETAGNEYKNLTIDGISITVYATQDTVESDSYDNQYDKNAQYPDVAYVAVSAPTAEDIAAGVNPLANALISASTETGISGEAKDKIAADLAAGTFKLTDKEGSVSNAVKGMEVTLNGAGADKTTYEVKKADASGEGAADYSFDGAKAVVFKNMTVEFGLNKDYQGFVRAGAVRFENCTIKGMGANWGVGDVVFDNCNFVFPEGGNEYTYNLWTYGGSSFTFNNCTFTSNIGKFINVYREGNDGVVDVTLNGCKFISNADSANKAAVKINGDHAWNVTINGCTTEGVFPTDNSGLWQIENAVAGNQITVDGDLAYSK